MSRSRLLLILPLLLLAVSCAQTPELQSATTESSSAPDADFDADALAAAERGASHPEAAEPVKPVAEKPRISPCGKSDDPWETQLCEAGFALRAGKLDESAEAYELAVAGAIEIDPDDPRVAEVVAMSVDIADQIQSKQGAFDSVRFLAASRHSAEASGGGDHIIVGYLFYELARRLYGMGNFAGADTACEEAAKRAEDAFGPNHPLVIGSSVLRGELLLMSGETDAAAIIADQQWIIAQEVLHKQDPHYVNAALLLARVRQTQAQFDEALALIDEIDEMSLTSRGEVSLTHIRAMTTRAHILLRMYRHEDAIEVAQEAVAFLAAPGRRPSRSLLNAYVTMATAAQSLGQTNNALKWARASLRTLEALSAKTLDDLLESLFRLSRIALVAERNDDAEGYLFEAGQVAQRMQLTSGAPAAIYNALGAEIAAAQERDEVAESTFAYALELISSPELASKPSAIEVLVRYTDFLVQRERWDEAELRISEAVEIPFPEARSRGPIYVHRLFLDARVQQGLGRLEAAEARYQVCLEEADRYFGPNSFLLISILDEYAHVFAKRGKQPLALSLAVRADTLRRAQQLMGGDGIDDGPGRHIFPDFRLAYELPYYWEVFEPRMRSMRGLLGFTWRQAGVMAIVDAKLAGDRAGQTTDEVANEIMESMESRLQSPEVGELRDRGAGGIVGREVVMTGTFRGMPYRYRVWVAAYAGNIYQLRMWAPVDAPDFAEPWAEFVSGFQLLPESN